jgi:aldehyde:ferredoxin oxidoreductase
MRPSSSKAPPKNGSLYKIVINPEGVKISDATELKLLGNYDLVAKLSAQYGEKVAIASIGPAGERKMCAASIAFTDMEQRPTRHAGRGGTGAVMGAKGIKAIVLDDAGMPMRAPRDAEAFKAANRIFVAGLEKHPVTGEGLPAYGTNVLTNVLNEAGGYPTNNFSSGRFDTAAKISGETQAELENQRGGKGSATHGCHKGCIIRCSGTYYDKEGNYLSKQPEYETVWSHGGNCGIDDLDATGMCLFIAFAVLDQPETFQALIDMLNSFYGLSLTADDVTALGESILKNERDFNKAAGFTAEHDRLPRFFHTERLAPHGVTFGVKDEELDSVFNW